MKKIVIIEKGCDYYCDYYCDFIMIIDDYLLLLMIICDY